MIDPASLSLAYAGCKAAVSGVRELVDFYKQAKATGKDVSGIVSEVAGLCGKFFSHSEQVATAEQKKAEELKANPKAKLKSLNEEALSNVMQRYDLAAMEAELREMMVYHMDQPGLWSRFTEERERLRQERFEAEQALKKKIRDDARDRQRLIDKWSLLAAKVIVAAVLVFVFCALMYGVHLDYQRRRDDFFSRAEFERRFASDPKVIDCWKTVQGTGVLPRFCLKD